MRSMDSYSAFLLLPECVVVNHNLDYCVTYVVYSLMAMFLVRT
jgi:hypothetical protein